MGDIRVAVVDHPSVRADIQLFVKLPVITRVRRDERAPCARERQQRKRNSPNHGGPQLCCWMVFTAEAAHESRCQQSKHGDKR
jgi:hypothetical protein